MQRLVENALAGGALEAKFIRAADVVVADWVALKCQYGCHVYGRSWACPPRSPSPDQTRRILSEYSRALMVRVAAKGEAEARDAWRQLNGLIVDLEHDAFLAGYRKAFAFGGGRCRWCEECDVAGPCKHPDKARPSMEACGIDIKATVRSAGWQYYIATSLDSEIQWFGLVLLE